MNDLELLFDFFNQVYPISESDFQEVVKYLHKESYNKGELILNFGQIETKVNFIINGIVHQYEIIDGNLFTVDIFLRGMSYNSYSSFIDEVPSKQVQEAITDIDLLYIEKKNLEKLLKQSHSFCYIHTKLYEQVHLEREKRTLLLQNKSAIKRYGQFLKTINKSKRFLEEVPQKLIANYLNMTPETYSRIKKEYLTK